MDRFVDVACPFCGETSPVEIDPVDPQQEFVQDCAVCCRPWRVRISIDSDGRASATAEAGD